MNRKEQKEQRRKDILYKGLELFVNKGYKATKITDIADELKISVGLLFHYFKSKEDLYYELIRLGVEGTNKPILKEGLEPLDHFRVFVNDIFNAIKNDINIARMFVLMPEATRVGTPEKVRELALNVNIIDSFIPIIIKGQGNNTIRTGDPKILSNAFFRSVYAVCEGYAINPSIGLPDPECMVNILRV
ncbi:MAG: TetR/AcrR family transcriptional regulator [Acholeplasmatales bacterium]|nr:TetR/AcrR family transcriptional regulator [Acholeplasmatales bacterium]